MSNEKENNEGLLKAIAEFLKNLFSNFGKNNSFGGNYDEEDLESDDLESTDPSPERRESPSIFVNESQKAEDFLAQEVDKAIEKDDILSAYMLEAQRIHLMTIREAVLDGREANSDPDFSSRKAAKSIESKMDSLKGNNDIKDIFQDYHNHNPDYLNKMVGLSNARLSKFVEENNMNTDLASIAHFGPDTVKKHMMELPSTPAEKAGIAAPREQENDNNSNNRQNNRQNNRDRSADNDISPSMNP